MLVDVAHVLLCSVRDQRSAVAQLPNAHDSAKGFGEHGIWLGESLDSDARLPESLAGHDDDEARDEERSKHVSCAPVT